jgi:ABC-2 type transport system ATP-binding protein
MTSCAIELTGLKKTNGLFDLGPLDLRLPRGGVVALLGNNGAGKTTTLDLVMGLHQPTGGKMKVLGLEHPAQSAEIKAKTAYVTPDLDFRAWKTVARALDFLSGFYPDHDLDREIRLLDAFGLSLNSRFDTHSFGERMKFLLVTALSRDPDLLLLDEPTVGLDVHAQQVLAQEIGALRQREDRTIIISSHQVSYLERLADHVIILHRGRLIATDRIDRLLERFVQIDVDIGGTPVLPQTGAVKRLWESGDRGRFLVDRALALPSELESRGFRVIEETVLTLEELFRALTAE